ncbi:hypothetical protein ACU635_25805 [[Actinomadura] parvosata]|uniref:hypothetical protein n=1 Tax=[Actinomadura] parvosata TaxID=1955412 RepID=UPI00406D2C95
MTFGPPPAPVAQNRHRQAIGKALNVDLKVTVVPDPEYGQKMTTLMASGSDPNLDDRASKGAQLGQIMGDGIAAVVFGRKPLSAWKDIVTQWRSAGGNKVSEELAKEHATAQ